MRHFRLASLLVALAAFNGCRTTNTSATKSATSATRPKSQLIKTITKDGKEIGQEISFRASNGKESTYKVSAPEIEAENGNGLLIYLHGDLGKDYDWFYTYLLEVAQKLNLMPIAIKAPSQGKFVEGAGPSWRHDNDSNALFLYELLSKDVDKRWLIDWTRVYFVGVSGGTTFLNGPWIRHYAHAYEGGAVNFCGGIDNTSLSFVSSADFTTRFKLAYYIGTADFLYDQAQDSIRYYKKQGFQAIDSEFPVNVKHCDFSAQLPDLIYKFVNRMSDTSDMSLQQGAMAPPPVFSKPDPAKGEFFEVATPIDAR